MIEAMRRVGESRARVRAHRGRKEWEVRSVLASVGRNTQSAAEERSSHGEEES